MTGPASEKAAGPVVLSLFGTRPEVIKFAPVIHELERRGVSTANVTSAQHRDLLYPLISYFDLRIDHDLEVMRPGQSLNGVSARVTEALDPILSGIQPDMVLVQGDTTTAMSGALAAWNRGIAVGHIEAGLRSGDRNSPFPEEMNRRLISQVAALHFAATESNRQALLSEGTDADSVVVTGNPVIDALELTLSRGRVSSRVTELLDAVGERRLLVLTTHRRESFGEAMGANLDAIRDFVDAHEDAALIFPVHPNPAVIAVAQEKLEGHPRVHLVEPLHYEDFLQILSRAWLLVSDSGGLQEEAPTLGKPLLILRENTERPEAVECGAARLIGGSAERLGEELNSLWKDDSWAAEVATMKNPFGDGTAAKSIVDAIEARTAVTKTLPAS
jgi:UDP-N-acetylglucosamine 2-epimerase (non-hydrolysing)